MLPRDNHIGIDVDDSMVSLIINESIPSLEDSGMFHAEIDITGGNKIVAYLSNGSIGYARAKVLDYTILDYYPFLGLAGFTGSHGSAIAKQIIDNFYLSATNNPQTPIFSVTSDILPAGWNLISLPYEPISSDPVQVFKNNQGVAIPISGNISRFDIASQTYVKYNSSNPSDFGNAKRDDGYWLYLSHESTIRYNSTKANDFEIDFDSHSGYLIGGASKEIPIANLQIKNRNTGEVKLFSDVKDQ